MKFAVADHDHRFTVRNAERGERIFNDGGFIVACVVERGGGDAVEIFVNAVVRQKLPGKRLSLGRCDGQTLPRGLQAAEQRLDPVKDVTFKHPRFPVIFAEQGNGLTRFVGRHIAVAREGIHQRRADEAAADLLGDHGAVHGKQRTRDGIDDALGGVRDGAVEIKDYQIDRFHMTAFFHQNGWGAAACRIWKKRRPCESGRRRDYFFAAKRALAR